VWESGLILAQIGRGREDMAENEACRASAIFGTCRGVGASSNHQISALCPPCCRNVLGVEEGGQGLDGGADVRRFRRWSSRHFVEDPTNFLGMALSSVTSLATCLLACLSSIVCIILRSTRIRNDA
jgi:hypothetical protein